MPEIPLSNGKYYDLANPSADVLDIEMIAGSLSKQCRFTGQTSRPYSVAEHCVRGSFIIEPALALDFLLHDAAESVVIDVPTPSPD